MIGEEDGGSQEAQDAVGVQGAGEAGAEERQTAFHLRADAVEEEDDADEQSGQHHQREQQVIIIHDDRWQHCRHVGVVKDDPEFQREQHGLLSELRLGATVYQRGFEKERQSCVHQQQE